MQPALHPETPAELVDFSCYPLQLLDAERWAAYKPMHQLYSLSQNAGTYTPAFPISPWPCKQPLSAPTSGHPACVAHHSTRDMYPVQMLTKYGATERAIRRRRAIRLGESADRWHALRLRSCSKRYGTAAAKAWGGAYLPAWWCHRAKPSRSPKAASKACAGTATPFSCQIP